MAADINQRSKMFLNVSYKIAAFAVHEATVDIGNYGGKDGRCSLIGVIGDVFSILFGKLQDKGFGCVAVKVDNFGVRDPITNKYDGALGLIQEGEADFVGMPVYFPLNETEERFRYSPLLHADTMTMISVYTIITEGHDGDIFSMFASIPYGLWIGYILSFWTFLIVTNIGSKVLGHITGSIWMTICAFLDQDNYPLSSSKFLSFMSVIVMLGMFFMMTYAGNTMGTDLVTIDKPTAITSYDQIIAGNIPIALSSLMPEFEKFSSAPGNSIEGILFKNHKALGMDMMTKMNEYSDLFFKQKLVMVTKPFLANAAALMIIGSPFWSAKIRVFVGSDPEASHYMNCFVLSSRLKGTDLEYYMNLIVGRLVEHGFAEFVQSRSYPLIVSQVMDQMSMTYRPSHEQFVTSKVEEQSPDVSSIGWIHVKRVLVAGFIGSVIGFVALIAEHAVHRYPKQKKCRLQVTIEQRRMEMIEKRLEQLSKIVEQRRDAVLRGRRRVGRMYIRQIRD